MAQSKTPVSSEELDFSAWRKAERTRLIDMRMAVAAATRTQWSERIAQTLPDVIGDTGDKVVSGYWPFRGEPELLGLLRDLQARGVRTALPVVVLKGAPLQFREWKSGDKLAHGAWHIPFPADGPEIVPDIVIAPVVGFDLEGYRLGYGGGFFDRTLAALNRQPRAIGVGFSHALMPTIIPQPHDIPMSAIITESGIFPLTLRADPAR